MYIFLYISVNFFILLKTKGKNVHRGEILEKVVKDSTVKITQLVKRMGISRGTYYNHTQDPHLPFELLEQYGRFLNYDFSQDIPEIRKFLVEEPEASYGSPKNLKEAIEQINYWKAKYIKLLEMVNEGKLNK
jgi:hypothetical protein